MTTPPTTPVPGQFTPNQARLPEGTVASVPDGPRPQVHKGNMLFQEEWAYKRKFRDRSDIIMSPLLILMGFVVIGLGVFVVLIASSFDFFLLMLPMIGVVLIIMGYAKFKAALKEMPFRIYENGFTLPEVGMMKGLKREENFIAWAQLEKFGIKSEAFMTLTIKQVRLVHSGAKELVLTYTHVTDPMKVLRILKERAPEKMDQELEQYLGSPENRRRMGKPIPDSKTGAGAAFRSLMPLGIIAFILLLMGPLLVTSLTSGKTIGFVLMGAIFGPVVILMLWMSMFVHKQVEKDIIKGEAQVVQGGVTIPNRGLGKVYRRVRDFIPFQEIKTFTTKLDPMFLSHEASFVLTNDEEYWFKYDNFEAARKLSGFQDRDLDLVNARPIPLTEPLARWNPLGILLILLLLGLVLPISSFGIGQVMLSGFESMEYVCLPIVFAVLVPILLVTLWLIKKRAELGEGFWATREGLHIPRGPTKFQFVPKNEFISASAEKDLSGLHISLKTMKGSLKMPHSIGEKLMAAGYNVGGLEGAYTLGGQTPPTPAPGPQQVGAPPVSPTSRPQGPGVIPPSPMAPATIKRHEGRGTLLLLQEEYHMRSKKAKVQRMGLLLTVGGLLLVVLGFFLQFYILTSEVCFWEILLVVYLFGAMFALIGPWIINMGGKISQIKIYEHGIVFPEAMRKDGELFIPYGQMTGMAEAQQPIWGSVHQITLKAQGMTRVIHGDIPGLGDHLEMIRKRIGDPAYDDPDFDIMDKGTLGKMEVLFYLIGFLVGFLTAGMIVLTMDLANTPSDTASAIFFYGAPPAMFFIIYAFYFLTFKQKKWRSTTKPNLKRFVATIFVLMLVFVGGLYTYSPPTSRNTIYADAPPGSVGLSNGTYIGLDLNMSDSIYVAPGKSLIIEDSVLRFELSTPKGLSIYVDEGGYLELDNVTICSTDPAKGYSFEIHGKAKISRSTIRNLYNATVMNGDGGLEIHSSDVLIVDSVIEDNDGNGVMVFDSSPTIIGNTFRNCKDDAIELNYANAIIQGNRFENNGWGVIAFDGSDAVIRDNTFVDNDYGVYVYSSDPTISENRFENTTNNAISFYDDCDPEIEDNTFINNKNDVAEKESMSTCFMNCGMVVFVIALIASLVLVIIIKLRKGKGPDGGNGQPPAFDQTTGPSTMVASTTVPPPPPSYAPPPTPPPYGQPPQAPPPYDQPPKPPFQ